MNHYTTMIYVVEEGAWWSFSAKEWVAYFSLALAGVRSGEGYELPDANRLDGPPECAQSIDGEDAWYSDRYDAEIFYLPGWDFRGLGRRIGDHARIRFFWKTYARLKLE